MPSTDEWRGQHGARVLVHCIPGPSVTMGATRVTNGGCGLLVTHTQAVQIDLYSFKKNTVKVSTSFSPCIAWLKVGPHFPSFDPSQSEASNRA